LVQIILDWFLEINKTYFLTQNRYKIVHTKMCVKKQDFFL
jgi:hypothetical protein